MKILKRLLIVLLCIPFAVLWFLFTCMWMALIPLAFIFKGINFFDWMEMWMDIVFDTTEYLSSKIEP